MLQQGDCLALLRDVPDASVDALITDPPYSSGGMFRSDRAQSTGTKYVRLGTNTARADFGGDNRDQRSFGYWCALWLSECFRIVKPGGYAMVFTDWRQLPTASDALQAGGFTWRGIVAWDKTEGARAPHTGYFRHQCEYLVWGTNGPCGKADGRGPFPGAVRCSVRQADKFHQAGKPVELMRQLLRCVPPGGVVLDPFAGSGSTGVACREMGLQFIGMEREAPIAAIAGRRIAEATPRAEEAA